MRYLVCGVDDSGLVELYTTDLLTVAMGFVKSYTRRADDESGRCGGYDLIEVYDQIFAEDPTRCVVYHWENQFAAVEAD